ncbi:MAG: ATPase, T2SS/T4P/T4SS family [bacterium]
MLNIKRKLIGEALIEKGLITREILNKALDYQKNEQPNKRIGEILIEQGYICEKDLALALAESLNIQFVDLLATDIDEELIKNIPIRILKDYKFIPISKDSYGVILIGMVDPLDTEAINIAREYLNTINVDIAIVTPNAFEKTILDIEHKIIVNTALSEITLEVTKEAEELISSINLDEAEAQPGIIRLVEGIFKQAITYRATDIHIEPTNNIVKVRYRIDGVLYRGFEYPLEKHPEVVSRIKIIALLDITEHRLPQEGSITVTTRNSEYDLRVSTLPSRYGEKVVVRILDKRQTIMDIHNLGFSRENINKIDLIISRPYGFVVVSGPTGAGKTTTLFSMLKKMDLSLKNVVTIEDPIEYQLEGITQTQVNERVGFTFDNALKYILRQDPDVILVGEIRDEETLRISIQASLTGHMVLSTIHANDAISTIIRMKEMNVNQEYLFSSLIGVINQRLVRVLCNYCKKPEKISSKKIVDTLTRFNEKDSELIQDLDSEITVYFPTGCPICNWSGYFGRTSITEIIIFDDFVKNLILENNPHHKIKHILRKEKKQNFLINDAVSKILNGITSIQEIVRVV